MKEMGSEYDGKSKNPLWDSRRYLVLKKTGVNMRFVSALIMLMVMMASGCGDKVEPTERELENDACNQLRAAIPGLWKTKVVPQIQKKIDTIGGKSIDINVEGRKSLDVKVVFKIHVGTITYNIPTAMLSKLYNIKDLDDLSIAEDCSSASLKATGDIGVVARVYLHIPVIGGIHPLLRTAVAGRVEVTGKLFKDVDGYGIHITPKATVTYVARFEMLGCPGKTNFGLFKLNIREKICDPLLNDITNAIHVGSLIQTGANKAIAEQIKAITCRLTSDAKVNCTISR